ncbi:MAG: hypothetical protein J1F28_09135 [Oscillospiraceae bacterium]|nr:hypothetical protein [Oscillospiraceae bacterium]
MIIDLDVIDHVILDEENKLMLMLIFDSEDYWTVEPPHGLGVLTYNKKCKDKNLEHLVYLKNKVENYIGHIQNNGIKLCFPDCAEPESYSYEIRTVTNFTPAFDYMDLIDQMNKVMSKQGLKIIITNEVNSG